jgi:uncharacterized protein DUF1295
MDRAFTSSDPGTLSLRLRNLASSALFVLLASVIYAFSPHNARQMERLYGWVGFSLTGAEFLLNATLGYVGLLAIFYLAERKPGVSKSLRTVRVAGRFLRRPLDVWHSGLERADRVAVLTTLLKGFFAPMMTMSLIVFLMSAIENASAIATSNTFRWDLRMAFDWYGFWLMLRIILFVDVLVFTIGYLVELPRLKNEIRSVDPTLMGWGAAMVCYPPFNVLTGKLLGANVSDFPRFDDPTAHFGLNLALLALLAIYASASVALGWKASNLTHRGVIARGPYAVIRHPAYVCKNMAWWIGSIPLVSAEFAHSAFAGVSAVASVVAWSMVYVLRALTEEDHLKSVDGEYAAYAAKVRYRFIPGVI